MEAKIGFIVALWSILAFFVYSAPAQDKPKNGSDTPDSIKVDKRSQEDIMFGNQQNKPSTIVDDLLVMPDSKEVAEIPRDFNDTKGEDVKKDVGLLPPMGEPSGSDYASFIPAVPEDRGGYEVDSAAATGVMDPQILYDIPDLGDYPPYDVTNALYRRKRNLPSQPLVLRKRSFRSSLGQLMGRRMSRSVLRSKRHTPLYEMNAMYDYRDLPAYSSPWLEQSVADSEELEDPEPAATPVLYVPPRQRRTYWYPPDYRYVRLAKRGDGRWGRFEAKEPPQSEDMLRLYALANLLADTEQPQYRYRRSAAPLAMA